MPVTSPLTKVLRLVSVSFFIFTAVTSTFGASGLVLTNVEQIRNLTATDAARSLPVQLRGVVVDESQPRERALILADQTGEIYLTATTNLFAPYHQKDLLEITGVTAPGEFAPIVLVTTVRKVGAAPLPAARPASYQQLITGAMDAQFVEISGVVRQCLPAEKDSDIWSIVLAADGGTFPVRISLPQNERIQVDAEVCIEAICFYQFNQKRQVLNPVLQVPRGLEIQIDKLPLTNPFAAPLRSSVSLLQFTPKVPYGHRVHLRGVVTCFQPGSLVWIRDDSSGLRIQTRQRDQLAVGDELDVLGFPGYGTSTPLLEDAIYQKIGKATPPVPLNLTDASGAYDNQDDLVAIEAKLTEIHPTLDGIALTLENSGKVFKAILKESANPASHNWQPGSRVRVTGICSVIFEDARPVMGIWQPQSFQILLRSANDIFVLQPPPWWTAKRIAFLLSLVAALSLAVTIGVVWLARRRLKAQATLRALAEKEFAAILAERNRLAREIHDTLAQGLTAMSIQMQIMEKHTHGASRELVEHLKVSQGLVRRNLNEARSSIWNMRSQVLESGSLTEALKSILTQLTGDTGVKTEVEVTGQERRLSSVIENNLLRIGQEAITNAVKYAGAKKIKLWLAFDQTQLTLKVIDDGCGFDPNHPRPSEGGFGLIGLRERAAELKGELQVRSAPHQGTEICLHIPLAG
jgi:signal transduction histidine kinase